jgi:hypothetical protein
MRSPNQGAFHEPGQKLVVPRRVLLVLLVLLVLMALMALMALLLKCTRPRSRSAMVVAITIAIAVSCISLNVRLTVLNTRDDTNGVGVDRSSGRKSRATVGRATRVITIAQWNLTLGIVGRRDLTTGSCDSAVIVLSNLVLYASPIWGRSYLRQKRADGLNQIVFVVRSGIIQSRLNNIIGIGIADKPLNLLGLEHLFNDEVLGRVLSTAQALLNDVGAEFVSRKRADGTLEHLDQGLSESRVVQINYVLNDVVSERVLYEDTGLVCDFFNKPELLVTRGMVDASLQYTAAMAVSANINYVIANGIEDKLSVSRT